jgi:hypothetical protein
MKAGGLMVAVMVVGPLAQAETVSYRLSTTGSLGRAVLAEGTKTYSPDSDIEIETSGPTDAPTGWSKRLELSQGFKLEAYVTREPALDGFGLVVTSPASPDDFSWNWFDRESGAVFTKRRGTGRLRVAERKVGELVELETVEFLDDVALTYRDNRQAKTPDERTHELLIKKGSVFRMAR